jgi:hypothetical protein
MDSRRNRNLLLSVYHVTQTRFYSLFPEGFQLANNLAYIGGAFMTNCFSTLFWVYITKEKTHTL